MKHLIRNPGRGLSGQRIGEQYGQEEKIRATGEDIRMCGKEASYCRARIIEVLEQAIAWTRAENKDVRVRLVRVPNVDVRAVRTSMGLSQAEFANNSAFQRPLCAIGNKAGRARMPRRAYCWL